MEIDEAMIQVARLHTDFTHHVTQSMARGLWGGSYPWYLHYNSGKIMLPECHLISLAKLSNSSRLVKISAIVRF